MAYTTIDDSSAHFQTKLYTGTGSSLALTNDGNSDLNPDLVWVKRRDGTYSHAMFDTTRGSTYRLISSSVGAEDTNAQYITSFNTDGFTAGTDANINGSNLTYVAWQWKKGTTPGFDIVAYTGNATARTISHGLGAIPKVIICKSRGSTKAETHWMVYHHALAADAETDYLFLDTTAAAADDTVWNDTAPTSSVFSLGTQDSVNWNTATFIAYLFAEVQGFSKFGAYEGNGNANGPFVHCGFKPAFVMTKSVDSTSDWNIFDHKREGYNVDNDTLKANDDAAELTTDMIDLLSNGFKLRIATDPNVAETYIYMAFAENPFVTSTGTPCTAR